MFIRSFGCQMNVYDAERMSDIASREGYREASGVEDADLIVLNTCHIRERASEKIYSELGKLRELKDERRRTGRETILVVAGCVAQAEGAEMLRRQPAVDVVVGPQSYHRLPELLREARRRPGVVAADFPAEGKFAHLPAAMPEQSPGAASPRSSPCRRDATSSARSASFRTPAAPRSRARSARSSTRSRASQQPACARSRCSDRTSTPITGLITLAAQPGLPADSRRRRRARDRSRSLYDLAPLRHE